MPELTNTTEAPPNDPTDHPAARPGPSDLEFVLEHRFTATAATVFAAYTDPALVGHWWVPTPGSLRVDAMEVRAGGRWRFVQSLPNGGEVVYSGAYREVRPPTRLVYSLVVEGQPWSAVTATVELRERDGRTLLTLTNRCVSREACTSIVSYGAAAGAARQWERLAALLARV